MTMTDPGPAGQQPDVGATAAVPPPVSGATAAGGPGVPLPPVPPPPSFGGPGAGAPGAGGPGSGGSVRRLRRSRNDRMISGVAGGLGEYFAVDAVIFRVLFAVLSFFGGVGLLMYALAWLLVPEPEIGTSALDKALVTLRLRRVPPWIVIFGGAVVLWLGWFSWWAPGPTFPALLLLAVLMLVLIHRLAGSDARHAGLTPPGSPNSGAGAAAAGAGGADAGLADAVDPAEASTASVPLEWSPPADGESPSGNGHAPLIPPLNDTRRSMQAWLAEAGAAHRRRIRRRRPIKVGVTVSLVIAWTVIALLDAFGRVPFPAYLWVGLAVLGAALLVSLLTRRTTLSLLLPLAVLAVVTFALGGTRASLTDGSGQISWQPTTVDQLTDHRQFAGEATLDLTRLGTVPSARTVRISQAAGQVRLLLPATLNATVISDVHLGEIQNGRTHQPGQHVDGMNVHMELPPPAAVTGQPLTIYLTVTAGHIQVERGIG